MENLPQIIIKEDRAQEVGLFLSFLDHPYYRRNREKILNAFPDLRDKLGMDKDEKQAIVEFTEQFYKENQSQIEGIIRNARSFFENKSARALKVLGDLMDYQWQEGIIYTAIPTTLPFSPFKGNTFFFSILADLKNKQTKERNALSVAIHEISHLIFFEKVKEIKLTNEFQKTSEATLHYLKEALAVIMLNQPRLKDILGIEGYVGNPELRDLRVKNEDKTFGFVEYLEGEYKKLEDVKKEFFNLFLKEVLKRLYMSDFEFRKKWEIWNQLDSVRADENLYLEKLYCEPIVI